MDIKKFERAKEIEKMDLAMGEIRTCISNGSIHIISKKNNVSLTPKVIEVPETVANVIYDALYRYQEELEKEFEEL